MTCTLCKSVTLDWAQWIFDSLTGKMNALPYVDHTFLTGPEIANSQHYPTQPLFE